MAASTEDEEPDDGGPAWPFVEAIEAASELDETPPDAATEPPGEGELLPEATATGPEGEPADDVRLDEVDPCMLVTLDEWATWRSVDVAAVEQIVLEDGEACGYLDEADTVRMALAVIELSGGSWLPDDVESEGVDVGGRSARWATGYPVEVSSVLIVALEGGELVVEMSARDGTDDQVLRAGAVELAEIAASRWSS